MYETVVSLESAHHIDMNCLALIIQRVSEYDATVYLEVAGRRANAKSLLGLMALPINGASEVKILAEGPEASAAAAAVSKQIQE